MGAVKARHREAVSSCNRSTREANNGIMAVPGRRSMRPCAGIRAAATVKIDRRPQSDMQAAK